MIALRSASPARVLVVPSPLGGPGTVAPLVAALRDRDVDAEVADLADGGADRPRLEHGDAAHADAAHGDAGVASAPLDDGRPVVLVGHSAAVADLPAIGARLRHVAAYVLVDGAAPHDGATRLDLLREDLPGDIVEGLAAAVAAGQRLPTWTDDELVADVPDPDQRAAVLAEVRPRGRELFERTLSVPSDWPDAPVAMLRLSPVYEGSAARGEARGWPVVRRETGHFAPLAQPEATAEDVLDVLARLDVHPRPRVAVDALAYDDRGLVPAIVQQHDTGEVLMLAWMSATSLRETLERGETVFWSRSRARSWHKGATSGNVQRVVAVLADCDADALLVRVDQRGPGGGDHGAACHTGARSCFHRPLDA